MNNDQSPQPTNNPNSQNAQNAQSLQNAQYPQNAQYAQNTQYPQNAQYIQNTQNMQNAPVSPEPKKTSKKLLAILITITIIIVAVAVVLIAIFSRRETPPTTGGEKPQEEENKGVVGFDPGNPLPDNEDLDADRSAEYSETLKVYKALNEPLEYSALEQKVKGISTKCTVSMLELPPIDDAQISDRPGNISCGETDIIRFTYKDYDGAEKAGTFNFAYPYDEQYVIFINELEDGTYEFGNDALLGVYSNKNRAINAYLYYKEKHNEYGK